MKKTIILFVLLMIIPLVSAADFTFQQNTEVDLKIPCFTNENNVCNEVTNCTISINAPNGVNIIYKNMSRFPLYYNFTMNSTHTQDSGVYDATMFCVGNATTTEDRYGNKKITFEITASGKELKTSTAGLAIIIFVLFIVIFLLFIGFRNRITTNELVDLIIKRCCFLLAIYFMILNSTMVATIAGAANIDLTREMIMYVSIFGYLGYAGMIYLMFKTIVDYLSIWNQRKREKRGFL